MASVLPVEVSHASHPHLPVEDVDSSAHALHAFDRHGPGHGALTPLLQIPLGSRGHSWPYEARVHLIYPPSKHAGRA